MLKLPDLLEIPHDIDAVIPCLFNVFKRDFLESQVYFLSDPVVIPRSQKPEDYPEVFWHIVTKQEDCTRRLLDFERAKRLVWLKPMIEGVMEPELLKWRCCEFDKRAGKRVYKYYIWHKEGQYLAVLKQVVRKRCQYYIATAFYVFRNNEQYFLNQYLENERYPWA